MFPREFEHEGEHVIAQILPSWYEDNVRISRAGRESSPGKIFSVDGLWCRYPYVFCIRTAKEILLERPRAASFVEMELFDEDPDTRAYLRTIYKYREDEQPWVNPAAPAILGVWEGRWILLDGNHRYARARRLGARHFLAFVLAAEEMVMAYTQGMSVSVSVQEVKST